jgi:hypothetical protein
MALAEVMEEKDDDGSKTHTGKRASDERYESKRNIRFSKNGTPHILCSLEDSFASSISNSFYDQPKLGCYPISVDLQLGNNSSLYISMSLTGSRCAPSQLGTLSTGTYGSLQLIKRYRRSYQQLLYRAGRIEGGE